MSLEVLGRFICLTLAAANASNHLWTRIFVNVGFGVIWFLVELFALTLVIYIAGRIVVGERRALFTDALIIAFLGTLLSSVFTAVIPYGLIALLLSVLAWLLLIKGLYETGWLGAVAVGLMAIIIFVAILIVMALLFGFLFIITRWLLWWL